LGSVPQWIGIERLEAQRGDRFPLKEFWDMDQPMGKKKHSWK